MQKRRIVSDDGASVEDSVSVEDIASVEDGAAEDDRAAEDDGTAEDDSSDGDKGAAEEYNSDCAADNTAVHEDCHQRHWRRYHTM